MRIAHFSDIHFFKFCWNPLQVFNKQLIGNFNYFFRRRRVHNPALPYRLIKLLSSLKVTHLVITGDYTCISSKKEFIKMRKYIEFLKKEGFTIYTLPGNHDSYTEASERKKSFYSHLSPLIDFQGHSELNLIDHRVAAYKLLSKWWLISVDSAHAMPYHLSRGRFSLTTETHLKELLASLPNDASFIMASHFPYDETRPKALLERGEHLKDIVLNHPKIRLFLHGHRHNHRIEKQGDTFILDSGSISLEAKSSFNLLDLTEDECTITPYHYQHSTWKPGDVQKAPRTLV